MPPEKVRLRIRNLAKAILVSGQAYQDPKDALNEFVSNAADEYAEADRTGERIRVVLRRKGRYPAIIIDDVGRGMSRDRLREVAQSLFESAKAGDSKTLGEKAIGMLAFQQLGQRCDVVSRTADSSETWTLRLERGKATAILEQERRRMRQLPGTSVYLSDLDPDVLRVLTQRKVVDYLRSRRGPGLARGDYEIEVIEGRSSEIVLPERPDGVRLTIPARNTLWGRIEFAIHVAPSDGKRRRVAVVGRAGTSVVDDLTELDEFDCAPWNSNQVSGQVVFESLQQSAGRRAILRDREAFPLFIEAVKAIEPAISRAVERVSRDVDTQTADRLSDQIRRIFGRVLKELSDMDNPMLSPGGAVPGEGGVLDSDTAPANGAHGGPTGEPPQGIDDVLLSPDSPVPRDRNLEGARPDSRGSNRLPTVLPDPIPREARSRFDDEQGIVFFNEAHTDYLMVKGSESALLDYLATLVAKEYVVYNNPRASSDELGEELVRMLVRVRRHIPRRSDSKSA